MPKTFKWYYGTPEGGRHAAETNMKKHGRDFYKVIGAKGGQNGFGPGYTGGFASSHELAVAAGRKGGLKSRRGPATHPRSDKGIPRKKLNADSNFVEHVDTTEKSKTKHVWSWPWTK